MAPDSRTKSLAKSISYIIAHEIFLFILVWVVTKEPYTAAVVALAWAVVETIFYYTHERIWTHIEIKKKRKQIKASTTS